MILGGSNCQLHALKRARARGIETVLIDYTAHPPGKELADVHIGVSTFDAEACIRAAKEERIDGVLAVGTDQPVLTAARVAEACGLPTALSVEQALAVTNKREMKRLYLAAGIPTPAWQFLRGDGVFTDAEGKAQPFSLQAPFVLKPLDSQGQRGVFLARSEEELLHDLPETLSFSGEDTCLVEEYIATAAQADGAHRDSGEITVSGWVRDGVFFPLTITDRLHYPDTVHIGVCTGHRYPSVYIAQKDEIIALCRQVTKAFSLTEGPFYFQILRRSSDGALFANEIACRIGGAFEDITIPYLTGFDILDAAIDLALGLPEHATANVFPAPACHDDSAPQRCFVPLLFCRPGTVKHITPAETLLALPGVADCAYNFKEGDTVPEMRNATARFGHAVIFGDPKEIGTHVRRFFETLRVESTTGEDLLQRELTGFTES